MFQKIYDYWLKRVNPIVFLGAALLTMGIIVFGGIWTEFARSIFKEALSFITGTLGWYYVLAMTTFLVFTIWLLFSRYGDIKLGKENCKPEFSTVSWFAMLFSAGMGMGLVFWGVAEPMFHYMTPIHSEAKTLEAAQEAMKICFFHWGLHPWAVYIIFALGIAFFHFKEDLPMAPRSLLYPLIGNRIYGVIGHITDIFCTVGTLLGVATSLGLGAMQINAALSEVGSVSQGLNTQLIIIAVITLIATASTVSGVSKGIKYLSLFNIVLMLALLLFVIIAGPTLFQLKLLLTSLGSYLQNIVQDSLWMELTPGKKWQESWSLFYWGWWISWAPFVGIFVARISKGRTVRQVIVYAFLLPSLFNFLWFAAFGGTALHIEMFGQGGIGQVVNDNVAMSLQALLNHLPFSSITQWVGLILIVVFFITSSDSGSLVDDMVTSGGNPNPPVSNRIFWGISEGAAAAVLLYVGGLKALQLASISAGLPQSVLLVVACVGLVIAFRKAVKKGGN